MAAGPFWSLFLSEVYTLRKAEKLNLSCLRKELDYFGQPLSGFFFSKDRRTASFQLPSSLSVSALGPRFAPFLAGTPRFLAFFGISVNSKLARAAVQLFESILEFL